MWLISIRSPMILQFDPTVITRAKTFSHGRVSYPSGNQEIASSKAATREQKDN